MWVENLSYTALSLYSCYYELLKEDTTSQTDSVARRGGQKVEGYRKKMFYWETLDPGVHVNVI